MTLRQGILSETLESLNDAETRHLITDIRKSQSSFFDHTVRRENWSKSWQLGIFVEEELALRQRREDIFAAFCPGMERRHHRNCYML